VYGRGPSAPAIVKGVDGRRRNGLRDVLVVSGSVTARWTARGQSVQVVDFPGVRNDIRRVV
jgi:hypothetical protein